MNASRTTLGGVLLAVAALAASAPAQADFKSHTPLKTQPDTRYCIGIGGGYQHSGADAGLFLCDGKENQNYQFWGNKTSAVIEANHSSRCLKVENDSFANGADIEQGSCSSPSADWQLTNFRVMGFSDYTFASIRNRYTGKCIGVPGGAYFHGNKIKQYTCENLPFRNQNWQVNPTGTLMP